MSNYMSIEQTKPQTCETCRHWKFIAKEWQCETYKCQGYEPQTEPQIEYKKWDTPPKVELPTEITTCISVLASALGPSHKWEERMNNDGRRINKKT